MSHRFIPLLVIISIFISLVGCGVKEKLEKKVSEKITEGVVNKVIGDEGKVDIDGDKVTIKGKDGEEVTIGSTEWPKDKAAKLIPEFSKGKIVSVMNSEEGAWVVIQEAEESDFDKYVQAVKDKGFVNEPMELTDQDMKVYQGSLDEKAAIALSYDKESKEATITLTVTQ
ncbi:DUF6591 domain-containing protein [Petroclostridium sp. X23]|uniref:DUF6591 domain-containing protein n=1 Tax=Petroclostridium sp. X23 TaxID=3045146 RepID=UPI0024ADAA83|nr:DUF6591 domain-containing protein [Petroclostridium sp. X23]WHH60927.1 hypothetical protein QKW49_09570 [Petroclostridium sp. X23]